jgi:hypothetical protein
MRVQVFPPITTKHLSTEETTALTSKVYDLISKALIADLKA